VLLRSKIAGPASAGGNDFVGEVRSASSRQPLQWRALDRPPYEMKEFHFRCPRGARLVGIKNNDFCKHLMIAVQRVVLVDIAVLTRLRYSRRRSMCAGCRSAPRKRTSTLRPWPSGQQ
jgi:hypothetical protein